MTSSIHSVTAAAPRPEPPACGGARGPRARRDRPVIPAVAAAAGLMVAIAAAAPPTGPAAGDRPGTGPAGTVAGDPDPASGPAPGTPPSADTGNRRPSVPGTPPPHRPEAGRPIDPAAAGTGAGSVVPSRPVPIELAPHRGEAVAAPGGDPPARPLRIEPGRYLPVVAVPGVGVPIEAVVGGGSASGSSGAAIRVLAHVRPHEALDWQTIEMRRLPGSGGRWQGVLPCTPCLSEPELWLQAIAAGPDGPEEGWWPPAGGSRPETYVVGYEERLGTAGDVVLGALAGGPGAGDPTWTGPAWPIGEARSPMVRLRWRLDPASAADAFLLVLVRPGGVGAWTTAAVLDGPRGRWSDLRIDVRDVLPGTQSVQVEARLVASGPALAQLDDVRLTDLGCSPGLADGPDVDGDGDVDLDDLIAVVSGFGPCVRETGCREDVTGDGLVDLRDALAVLGDWSADESGPATDAL